MERKAKVTQAAVDTACDELLAAGKNVTVNAVIGVTGGSFSTVGAMVKAWKAEQVASATPVIEMPEAITKAMTKTYDCILMDMQMPVMDGFIATQTLRDQGYTGRIIALSALKSENSKEKCFAAGCNDFYNKPALPDTYHKIIESLHKEPVVSRYQNDPSMRGMIAAFAERLPTRHSTP